MLAKCAIKWVKAEESVVLAEIGMAFFARPASPAGNLRIDRHSLTGFERQVISVERAIGRRLHDTHEFMPGDKGLVVPDTSDMSGLVKVKIGSADAHRTDADEGLAGRE
jgi:hypothetical protein